MQLPNHAILILEDVGEPYYRLERSFWQLFESFAERRPAAVCLAASPTAHGAACSTASRKSSASTWRPSTSASTASLPSGHGDANFAWPYGRKARLQGDELSW